MQILKTSGAATDGVGADEILETLLVEAGAAGFLPTDQDKLLAFLGLEQLSFDFVHELDFLDTPEKPPGELRAALHLLERVVATQAGMPEQRTRFSVFHEIGHCVLPDHHAKLFVDTDQTLSWWTKVRLEREANQFAADLLFQGKLFSEMALGRDVSLKSVVDLAPQFRASFEATFRRYAETHVSPCALIVYDKISRQHESYIEEDDYRLQYTITSAPFRKLYFSGLKTTTQTCKAADIYGTDASWNIGTIAQKELTVNNGDDDQWRFETELFNNGYKVFQFIRRLASLRGR